MSDFDCAVLEFMRDYSSVAQYISISEGTYNPSTGSTSPTSTTIPVDAILMDLTLKSNGLSVKYDTLVQAGDKEAYVRPPQTDVVPTNLVVNPASDRIVIAGVEYKIVTFKELNPTGTAPILFSLYLRR
jgi:hypothetical protein